MDEQNKPLAYTANDWFYLKPECIKNTDNSKCVENKDAVNQFRNSTDRLDSESAKYNDAKVLYNRELLFTLNMIIGLALIFYYIYINKSSLLNTEKLMNSVSSVTNKLTPGLSKRALM